ncbi:MAG: succinate dehydrogenase/fumarate reductase cytochrome b subunit [Gammaproteobacteria bacterium HGW-Gammaproteobacteria-8]|nr:MAG: succinate dehydrogenase/fumarate reductase cytochrome b subunit [Gammaproteobacteria bacterium HGW-Gammaproteobacteria-8]
MIRASRVPARLDVLQGVSGLFLALFMWLHMLFVSSILLGKDAFWHVARFFEGYHLFGKPFPILVSLIAALVFAVLVVHAALALRKFPSDWKQYSRFRQHARDMKHGDTTLWFIQVWTGFAMFFLASVHLYTMMTRPETIGPYGSADRIVSDWFWPLYLVLLFAVELHGTIGLYRLAVKWGWLEGKDPNATRRNMKRAKWLVTIFFLTLGLLSLAAYIRIGIDHRDHYGELYAPSGIEWPVEKSR